MRAPLVSMKVILLALVAACAAPEPLPPLPPPPPPRAVPTPAPIAPAPPACAMGASDEVRAAAEARIARKRGSSSSAKKQMVVASHPLATEAGLAVLRAGGTAADAFVATVLVQDVVLPGVTSTAGIAGVLVYDAKSKELTYVHGGVADPIDPARRYVPGQPAGRQVLVPGAPAAYATLVRRFGKKPLRDLVEPAAKLAKDGFPVDALYARSIAASRARLERSAFGKATFFENGAPIAEGKTIKIPEMAATLRAFGKDPSFFHKGPWVREAIAVARASGGDLTEADFSTYAPEIGKPMHATFMGHDLFASGHGGLKALTSLRALEILREGKAGEAPSTSPDAMATLLRVQRRVGDLPPLHDRKLVTEGADPMRLAEDVARDLDTARATSEVGGSHSSAAIVVDAEGNVVVGTHTIESLNWGEGLFAGGVPLSTSAPIAFDDASRATSRVRIDPLSSTIAMRDGKVRAALTVYGTGLHPADVQILDAVLARGVDPERAVLEPRVGYFQYDMKNMKLDRAVSTADPRLPPSLFCAVKERGFALETSMPGLPAGFVDTGFPTLVTIDAGAIVGMPPDPSHITGRAAGD